MSLWIGGCISSESVSKSCPPLRRCMCCTSVRWNFGRLFSSLAGGSLRSEATQQLWPSGWIVSARKQKNYLSLANCIVSKRPPSSFNAANGRGGNYDPKMWPDKDEVGRGVEGWGVGQKKTQCIGRRSNLIKLVHLTAWHLSERSREIPSLNLAQPSLSSACGRQIIMASSEEFNVKVDLWKRNAKLSGR